MDEDEKAQELFDKSISKNGDRYCVRLPQRPNAPPLPTNKNLCLSRLNSTIRKLKSISDPPNLLEMYDANFSAQESEQIIEEVPQSEMDKGGMIHYLPHQAVYRHDKKKLRIVFDCSAHIRNHPSLNDILYRGPLLLPKVAAVILRWRQGKIVIACDIKSAFLMLDLHPNDRDLTRFIWLKDFKKPATPSNLKIMRFRRVLFGAVSSPFLLQGTIVHHLRNSLIAKQNSELAREVEKSIYMDNILITAHTETEGQEKIKITREIFKHANMELREFIANKEKALESLAPEDRIVPQPKFLGINWDISADTMSFHFPGPAPDNWTMRKILRVINGIFDPLGLLNPTTLIARLFFQSLWALQLKWDTPLPDEIQNQWGEIISEWRENSITIQRFSGTDAPKSQQIHVFCDASEKCFGANVYLRATDKNGASKINLLFARARLAPKNWKSDELTIPKLELLGILIGTRAGNFVKKELALYQAQMFIWSDSEIALHWVGSRERRPIFIENRVKEIRKCDAKFLHVATESNPADYATRGVKPSDLGNLKIWWNGPKWLQNPESAWPKNLTIIPPKDEGEELIAQFAAPQIQIRKRAEIDPTKFSSWNKMILTMMYMLRFIRSMLILKSRECSNRMLTKFSFTGGFSAKDYLIGELLALKEAQNRSTMAQNEKIAKDFALFTDSNGILRSKSRLKWSQLPSDSIEPIYLPRDDRVSTLIVLDIHKRYFHAGVQQTHYIVIQKFCGLTKRNIKQILGQCLECKHKKALPYSPPPFPPYPAERVQQSPIFSHIGLDYLGPTVIMTESGEKKKLWVLLITCLATRAVWLDSILDLSTSTFLNALRRFIAKRGCPKYILSDNATNFILAAKTIENLWEKSISDPETQNFAAKEKIHWKFITPMASWEGGAYERLCGIAKNAFKRAIGQKILHLDEMNTVIAEVEGIMNSRPLVPMDDNPDSVRAIRPFDFLRENGQTGLPPVNEEEDDEWKPEMDSAEKMVKLYQNSLRARNKFWKVWEQEYLNYLKERKQQHHKKHGTNISPRIGEVVIVSDDSTPKAQWKLGRITELPPGDPFTIRWAKVRMANGHVLKRALAHLTPLEIGGPADSMPIPNKPQQPEPEPEQPLAREPRQAKIAAKQKIAQIAEEEQAFCAKISGEKRSSAPTYPFLLLIIISLFASAMANATLPHECQEHEAKHLIHVEGTCNSKGILVYAKNSGKKPALCYQIAACGEKRLSKTYSSDLGWECTNNCGACPDWASGCSLAPLPPLGHETFQISVIEPPEEAETDGDSLSIFVPTIELYDGRQFPVRQLQLRAMDTYDKQSICVGEGPIIGTPHYCSIHDCMSSGSQFCYYPHHEHVFYTTSDGEIPIKTWGNVRKQINTTKKKRLICQKCHLQCTRDGIMAIFDAEKFKKLELCCKPYCFNLDSPASPASIVLPKDILLNTHTCVLNLWTAKSLQLRREISATCPSRKICELIDCYVCTELLANPECWPNYATVIGGIIFTFLIIFCCKICLLLHTMLSVLGQCFCCARVLLNAFRFIAMAFRTLFLKIFPCKIRNNSRRRRGSIELTSTRRNRSSFRPFIPFAPNPRDLTMTTAFVVFSLIAFFFGAQNSQGATQFTSFMASEEDCTTSENNQTYCRITKQTILTLTPSNHLTQLLIRGPNGLPMGQIDIIVDSIAVECEKSTEYFSRSHEIRVHSSKRCPKQGSCVNSACADTKMESKIPELESANKMPGNTFCADSCSFLMCGCGLPTTSCIFYRPHAIETSKKIYEFFECPTWHFAVDLTVRKFDINGREQTKKARLINGIGITLPNGLKLTINDITKAPTPILATRFLHDGKKVMLANGINSKLNCATHGEAEAFTECKLEANACQCTVTDPTISCQCEDGNLDKQFSDHPDKVLPINTQNLLLKNDGFRVFAQLPYASIQLQVALDSYQLIATHENAICKIKPIAISGCYSCLAGAKLKLSCTPNFGTGALALISCKQSGDRFQFSLFCDGDAEIPIMLDRAKISATCSVHCPAGNTTFELKGQLNFVAQRSWVQLRNSPGQDIPTSNSLDWLAILPFFFGFPQSAYLLLAIIGTIIFAFLLLKCNPIHRCWKTLFRALCISLLISGLFSQQQAMEKSNKNRKSPIPPAVQPLAPNEYGPALPPNQPQQVHEEHEKMTEEVSNEVREWWSKKHSGNAVPDEDQIIECSVAAGFKTREEYLDDCAKRAKKLTPLLNACQRLQNAALSEHIKEGLVKPAEQQKASAAFEGRNWALDHEGLSDNEIAKVEGLLKLGNEVIKSALRLHAQYKEAAQLKQKADVAIVKARNELDGEAGQSFKSLQHKKDKKGERPHPYRALAPAHNAQKQPPPNAKQATNAQKPQQMPPSSGASRASTSGTGADGPVAKTNLPEGPYQWMSNEKEGWEGPVFVPKKK